MSGHACPRCGIESPCARSNWPDRHPAAAVTLAVLVLAMCTAHPWLIACAGVGGLVYLVRLEHGRRQALAARADWEHRALLDREGFTPPRPAIPLPSVAHRPTSRASACARYPTAAGAATTPLARAFRRADSGSTSRK